MNRPRLLLYAPNVNIGGGLVLLKALLRDCPAPISVAFLDQRAQSQLRTDGAAEVLWCRPTLASRLGAEWRLWRIRRPGDVLVCLHNLPPLLPGPGNVTVFVQNRSMLRRRSLAGLRGKTALRTQAESLLLRWLGGAVDRFVVQTVSMAADLRAAVGLADTSPVPVVVMPFSDPLRPAQRQEQRWDFIYPADGALHKNHGVLIDAWVRLARLGVRPSLLLTVAPDSAIGRAASAAAALDGVRIECSGSVPHGQLLGIYAQCSALVFPSLMESFGLPLVEATGLGLPIVAAELDYVRDICKPAETFDPRSAVSLSRAVLRHMGREEAPAAQRAVADFWAEVLPQEGALPTMNQGGAHASAA
jgi:glycosyltransferase involved in cell wall biosynthesis